MIIPKYILSHWEKLCTQTDPGPWEPIWDDDMETEWSGKIRCGLDGTMDQQTWEPARGSNLLNAANIKFCCSARTAVPLLIMEINDLRAQLEEKDEKNDKKTDTTF